MHPLVETLFPQEQRPDLPVAGKLKHFEKKEKKIYKQPSNFGINGGL